MKITVRTAVLEDAPAITALSRDCLGYDYPEPLVQKQLEKVLQDEVHRVWVAEADGNIAGFLHAHDYDVLYSEPLKNILGIAVFPQYRRLGIGRLLLDGWKSGLRSPAPGESASTRVKAGRRPTRSTGPADTTAASCSSISKNR